MLSDWQCALELGRTEMKELGKKLQGSARVPIATDTPRKLCKVAKILLD